MSSLITEVAALQDERQQQDYNRYRQLAHSYVSGGENDPHEGPQLLEHIGRATRR